MASDFPTYYTDSGAKTRFTWDFSAGYPNINRLKGNLWHGQKWIAENHGKESGLAH
jgi:hypothetical protein